MRERRSNKEWCRKARDKRGNKGFKVWGCSCKTEKYLGGSVRYQKGKYENLKNGGQMSILQT